MILFSVSLTLSLCHCQFVNIYCDYPFNCSNITVKTTVHIADDIYARGYKSMWGPWTASDTTLGEDITVEGSYAAQYNQYMIARETIECYGEHSCSYINNITSVESSIYCYGAFSCIHSAMTTLGSSRRVYCYGDRSCVGAYIFGTPSVYGRGPFCLYNVCIR